MPAPADVVRAVFAAFSARDLDGFLALCDDDVRFWPQGTAEGAGRVEPYVGLDGIRAYWADIDLVWRSLELVPGELRKAGDAVVAFGRASGVRVSGTAEDVPVIWVFKLRGGRVIAMRSATTAEQAMAVAAEAGA